MERYSKNTDLTIFNTFKKSFENYLIIFVLKDKIIEYGNKA